MLLSGITFVLLAGYAGLIFYYYYFLQKMVVTDFRETSAPPIRFSIIIPARNEENNISNLLTAISLQQYPRHLFEVIVIDDHSSDNTAAIVQRFSFVTLIRLKEDGLNSYKKKALEKGVARAANEWIITTDADCIPGPWWLHTYAVAIEKQRAVFITGPVKLTGGNSILAVFQQLDFLTLQGITAASVAANVHSMCNGANMAYRRDVFYEVKGFAGIDHIASGDDMLLMFKIGKQYPGRLGYIYAKEAIVETAVMPSWKAFFQQRIRWASKAAKYEDKRIFWVLLWVYLFNAGSLLLLVAAPFVPSLAWYFLIIWVLKTAVEYPFVKKAAVFFNYDRIMRYFFLFQPLHILYTVMAGFLGQRRTYEWKGRNVK